MFQTYIHQRADDLKVFYVGKGSTKRAHSNKIRNAHWHAVVAKHGRRVVMCGAWETEAEAFEHERFLIQCFRDLGSPLTNCTDGGEGTSGLVWGEASRAKASATAKALVTPEFRAARSARAKEQMTPAHREKMSAAFKAAWTPEREAARLAATRSAEARAKMSTAARARMTAERRIEIGAISKARMTPEHKAKLAVVNTGKKFSAETIAKRVAKTTGLKRTQEAKDKMRAIRLAYWANKKQCK